MKSKNVILSLLLCLILVCLASCANKSLYKNKTKVIYELEGGSYQNCTAPITQYYNVLENESINIYEPSTLSKKDIIKTGYKLEGWYKKKNISNDVLTYSEKWDFETDKLTKSGLTLYAKWVKDIKLVYQVCYLDENSNLKVLGSYDVKKGAKFKDLLKYADKRIGFTSLGYYDEDGNLWDDSFVHPGGNSDTIINVYVKYIEGKFNLVYTKEDLIRHSSENIYLMNDIDMQNEKLSFYNYDAKFVGNNHTISNFKISYGSSKNDLIPDFTNSGNSLCISLFGNIENAVIKDVKFTNASLDIKTSNSLINRIYVAPIAVSVINSTISNVFIDASFMYSSLPKNFNVNEDLVFETKKAYYLKDDKSKIIDFTSNIILEN